MRQLSKIQIAWAVMERSRAVKAGSELGIVEAEAAQRLEYRSGAST
jgi:hypothetical protein